MKSSIQAFLSALLFSQAVRGDDIVTGAVDGGKAGIFGGGDRCESRGCYSWQQQLFQRTANGSCRNRCVLFAGFAKRQGWECGTCGDATPIEIEPEHYNTRLDLTGLQESQVRQAFVKAAERWDRVLSGDIPDYDSFDLQGISSCVNLPGIVDDVYLCVVVKEMDGKGGVLGKAGSEFVRKGSGLPITGQMFFDTQDVQQLISRGQFENVILHEIAHVYGISSSAWKRQGITSNCVYDRTLRASREWQSLTGCPRNVPIPVETGGGTGTACSHWAERCLKGEVMSGYLSGGMELSRMTVAAMDDLGYDVDYDEADEFGLDKLDPGCVKDLCGERQSLRGRLLGESDIPDDIFDHNGEDSGRLAAVAYGKESLSKAKPAFRPSTVAAMRSGKAGDTSGAEYVADQFVSVIYEDDQGEVRSVAVTKD